ncbi:hypothetical protein BBK82_47115 [Lentzea guizhouensis]|uniref:Bacterial transcriptional activator domain-containing protein n=1 Tax=Lentzea guizhouensis TaxID=1586287 RepID=A0A1B2HXE5_9PSEU|nr:hypothetical protein [Lentzea guizhouensis]ANZ42371.1 hypothetical protein BBK82_47115 [Lentzea guizhouensis]
MRAEFRAPEDLCISLRYVRAEQLLRADMGERALVELQAIVAQNESTAGRFAPRTVYARVDLVDGLGELGQRERALEMAKAMFEEYRLTRSPDPRVLFVCRRVVAHWAGMCGSGRSALRALEELRDEVTEWGWPPEYAINVERRIRLWRAIALMRSGHESQAYCEFHGLVEDVRRESGESGVRWLGLPAVQEELQARRNGSGAEGHE